MLSWAPGYELDGALGETIAWYRTYLGDSAGATSLRASA
jgi:hypothetical protein